MNQIDDLAAKPSPHRPREELARKMAEHVVAAWESAPARAAEFAARFGLDDEAREKMTTDLRAMTGGSELHEASRVFLGLAPGERLPDGTPGVRDVDAPCFEYEPGEPDGRCETDGHHLCGGCRHKKEDE